MTCPHMTAAFVASSLGKRPVFKDECTLCFETAKSEGGLDICLKCFNGGCAGKLAHGGTHATRHSHPLALNIRSVLKNPDESKEPVVVSKIAIGKAGGVDFEAEKYEIIAKAYCHICKMELDKSNPTLAPITEAILASHSDLEESQIKEWEQEIKPCKHSLELIQPKDVAVKVDTKAIKCTKCELNTNLWLCLTCGNFGCGRKYADGSGANNHAVEHFESTGHPVVVKMGTITPDGKASVHCYACDEDVIDPNLGTHLAPLGIDVQSQVKTEKTIAELSLALNLAFSLSQTYESSFTVTPLYGPSLTGIENQGNTCYIAVVIQMLFSLPEFKARYFDTALKHMAECKNFPPDCFQCQMAKVAYGLHSGEYSVPIKHKQILYEGITEEEAKQEHFYQQGIRPSMFKRFFGKDHPDFSNSQQQDASLYFVHMLDRINKFEKLCKGDDPTKIFRFELEIKLKCLSCGGVKYQKQSTSSLRLPIPVFAEKQEDKIYFDMLKSLECFGTERISGVNCPKCNKPCEFEKSQRFLSFPKVMVFDMQREVIEGMMIKKNNVLLTVPVDKLDLQPMQAAPHSPEEVLLEDVAEAEPEINVGLLNELLLNGIPELHAKHALYRTGNQSSELAISWYFENMGDPSLNLPLPKVKKTSSSTAIESNISTLMEFGYTREQAIFGLEHTDNNIERAVDYICNNPMEEEKMVDVGPYDSKPGVYRLHGFITHLGVNATSGHYVNHIMTNGKWIYFNDRKVGSVDTAPLEKGTMFFFIKQ